MAADREYTTLDLPLYVSIAVAPTLEQEMNMVRWSTWRSPKYDVKSMRDAQFSVFHLVNYNYSFERQVVLIMYHIPLRQSKYVSLIFSTTIFCTVLCKPHLPRYPKSNGGDKEQGIYILVFCDSKSSLCCTHCTQKRQQVEKIFHLSLSNTYD